jgi:hypothetical protein
MLVGREADFAQETFDEHSCRAAAGGALQCDR